jgi:hypothetical protein
MSWTVSTWLWVGGGVDKVALAATAKNGPSQCVWGECGANLGGGANTLVTARERSSINSKLFSNFGVYKFFARLYR